MENKRRHKRIQLNCFLNVFDVKTKKILGQILDITIAGFLLMHQELIDVHTLLRVKIELPEIIMGANYLELEGKSVWSVMYPGMFNTGFHIEKISPEQIAIISLLIDKYGINNKIPLV